MATPNSQLLQNQRPLANTNALLNANPNSRLVTYEEEKALLDKWVPIVYFEESEKYFPASMDWIVANGKIMEMDGSGNYQVAVERPTNNDMFEYGQKYGFPTFSDKTYLDLPSSTYTGQFPKEMYEEGAVPTYAYIREGPNKNTLRLTYMFTYAYNGEYPILWLQDAGQHPYDLEHITVEINRVTGDLIRVYYGAHGPADGVWTMADEVPIDSDGKIIAYSARTGHGLYPKVGGAFRLFGISNDITGKGQVWNPRVVQIVPKDDPRFNINTMGWTTYIGRIGSLNGTTSLPDKSWYQTADPETTKPPRFISTFQLNLFRAVVYGLLLFVAYKLFRGFQYIVDKMIDNDKIYRMPEYIIGYIVFTIFTYVAAIQIKKVILKYTPS
jgi:hypothetical protein